MDKKIKAKVAAIEEVENLSQTLSEKNKILDERYHPQFGEGKANPFDAACSDYNGAADGYLNSANSLLEQTQKDYLDALRRYLNNQIYYDQYTKWPEQFELAKVIAKRKWLGAINQKVMFHDPSYYCQKKDEIKPGHGKLQEFDDVHCEYHSELKLPLGNIKVDCSRVTTELDLKVIKLGLKQNMEKETFGDQFMSCSVEVGAGSSVGFNSGVIKAEVGIGGSIRAEFDRTGLTDVVIKTEAGISLGTDIIDGGSMAGAGVSDLSLNVGVKGQISLVSGKSSVESTGLLDGVFKK
jgi:hypothetical protein